MRQPVDLTNCDREPIHIPGSIQPHGALLVFDGSTLRIQRHSANAGELLGRHVGEADDLVSLLGAPAGEAIDRATLLSRENDRPGLLLALETLIGRFDLAVHPQGKDLIVELEPVRTRRHEVLETARSMIAAIRSVASVSEAARRVPLLLRDVLGYDRVMMYRFSQDGSGKVIGESRRLQLESFLGQHFPASDIPQQARALYLRNTIRIISDASGPSSPLLPREAELARPTDLSLAHLRSVSPVHLEYLRNMGVGASMSISIIVNGELWGMIACHHYQPRILSMSQRIAAEMFGDFLSLHLSSILHRRRFETSARVRDLLDAIGMRMTDPDRPRTSPGEALAANLEELSGILECDGIGLWMGGKWTRLGHAVDASFVPALVDRATLLAEQGLWSTSSLSREFPQASAFVPAVSGVLAVQLNHRGPDHLFFFRREQVQTIEWAGDPTKSYGSGPLGERLTPRRSFALWKEEVAGSSPAWSGDDLAAAQAARSRLRDAIMQQSEIVQAERQKSEIRQRILNEELNHRVKNILALIGSLIGQPEAETRTIEEFVTEVKGRIMALAFAHDQVIRSDGGGSLLGLLEAELSPYSAHQITLSGEDVGLDSRAYSVLALVLHELATNAAKHGALSVSAGHLDVEWAIREEGAIHLRWRERGGPPPVRSSRRGFGSILLERTIPFDLGGRSELDYAPNGLEARLQIPARFLSTRPVERRSAPVATDVPRSFDPSDKRLLVLEDQLLIALDAEAMLMELGARSVSIAANVEEALRVIEESALDGAILDINLGSRTSIPVADELDRRQIPFIFATGYGDTKMVPDRFRDVPTARKPYSADTLRESLCRATVSAASLPD